MAENINWTLYFPSNERCIAEFEILNTKLQVQLKADLSKVYSDSLYSDLELVFDSGSLRTHSALLRARAPQFYAQICSSPSLLVLSQVDRFSVESFVRDVYTDNKLEDKEVAVVEYLSKVKKLNEEVLTPESDTYATPELTPTDVKHTFGHTRCVSDSGLSSLADRHTTNTLYYSLVTVDEVYSSDSADILEKELAEQDQLFKSFKSIISKDSRSSKGEVKSFYLTPKNRSTSFQNNSKHSSSKKKNGLELKLPLRLNFKDKYSLTQFDNNVNGNVPKKPSLNLEQFANCKEFNTVEDTVNVNYLWNSGSAKRFSLTERQCEPNKMSKVKPETEESMEGESVAEAVSSGYLTGSSPKELTESETVTGKDIPHDNDQSARSSSVSSDAGTWEAPVLDRKILLSDHDSSVSITNSDNLNIDAFTVCYPANSPHVSNTRNTLDNSSPCKEFPTNYEYSQIGSSESGNGSRTHSSPSTNEEIPVDNKLCNGKSNFFIDAASLLDESEISSIPPNSLSYNGHEFGEYNSLHSWSDNTASDKPLEMTNKLDSVVNHDNCRKQKEISPKDDNMDLEMRRSSLIRRNTFELEPDDERLAVLRNEYERHTQRLNNQHQNSFNPSLKGALDNNASLNKFPPDDKHPPNSLPFTLTQPKSIPKGDEDMHSPDSLNNDNPSENPFETCLKNDNPSYSLPYVINSSSKLEKQPLYNHSNQTIESLHGSLNPSHSNQNIPKACERQLPGNKLDSAPILSGGVSLKDISSPEKPFSSPLMNRRKTELAPIVSGGSVIEPEVKPQPKPRTTSSLSSSWIVDMSDTVKSPQETRKDRKRDPLSSVNSSDSPKSEESAKPARVTNSSLGFFVPLEDPFDEKSSADSGYKSSNFQSVKDNESEKNISRFDLLSNEKNNSNSGSSCGFYVDFNDTKTSSDNAVKDSAANDKKLFSMFIDISESGDSGTKSKTSSPLAFKKRTHTRNHSGVFSHKLDGKNTQFSSQMSSESSLEITESPEVSLGQKKEAGPPMHLRQIFGPPTSNNGSNKSKKQGFYMFVGADPSPTAQRRTLPSSSQSSSQRHSWNSDCDNPIVLPPVINTDSGRKKIHRRSHSVAVNKSLEVMFNIENQDQSSTTSPAFKVSTSNSMGYESGPSSIDDTASRHHNSMMASWHGSVKQSSDLQKVSETVEKKEILENKAHTRSLVKSRSESKSEHLSEMSRSGDRSEMTCSSSRDDNLCDLSKTSNESSSAGINNSTFIVSDVSNVANATSNDMELTTPTCDLASQFSKDDSDKTETDFDENAGPKSADVPRTPDHSISQVEIPVVEHKFSFVKLSDMDKEPKKKMVEGKCMINRMSRSIPEASWIESKMMTRSATSRSLSRLFPHLRNKTPDSADHDTDYSEMSSMQSSMDPSALEVSTEDTDVSCCGGPVSRLGEDLLRMFLDEISPDVTVEVGGRRIKAHKCILSSRCQYFAAILSGGWVESAGNVISLQGFSYSAVHFALCHIYSGASNIPDSINIVELATLADMLCLEGLKEVIMYTLKAKYCHFFHKPCPMCTVGVLECLPLAAAYGLDEIYRKSLRWISKYFVRVWPTKGFATLPRELIDKCYKQHIVHMTVDNVLETVLCCSKLQGLIPNVRWAEPVFNLTNKLHDAAVKFIALHFSDILSSDMFMSLGKEQMWSMSQLEETLLSAAEKLPPDQACKCHSHLYKLTTAIQAPSPSLPLPLSINDGFVEFLRLLSSTVEGCLLKQAARASRTPAWTLMEPQLRHKIQDTACLVIVPGDDRRRARHLLKRGEGSAPNKRSVDSAASKASVSETAASRKVTPVRSSLPATTKPKTPQPTNKADNSGPRPKTWPYKISEVKSRYLEPKQTPKQSPALTGSKPDKSSLTPTARRSMNKQIISSSDSSRTSSPATRRSVPPRASKRDDLTMSTDSLADPPLKKKPEPVRIDFVERNMRAISIKTNTIKFPSGEVTQRKASSISRIEDKAKHSPIPLSKRSSSQSSPATAALKSTVNSTPSPSNRHNTLSPKEKSQVAAETKSSMLKRTSTYRVQAKSASPNKAPAATLPNVKGNINKIQSKVNGNKKPPNNNNYKTEPRPVTQPMVGSRSGTFLKDEPTVLKKPQVVNVSE